MFRMNSYENGGKPVTGGAVSGFKARFAREEMTMNNDPAFGSEDRLDDALSEPTEAVVEAVGRLPGDIVLFGVAGKMGLRTARMARRDSEAAGVSRFSAGGARRVEGARTSTSKASE